MMVPLIVAWLHVESVLSLTQVDARFPQAMCKDHGCAVDEDIGLAVIQTAKVGKKTMDWREEMAENNSNKKAENALKKKGSQFAAEEKALKTLETYHKLAQDVMQRGADILPNSTFLDAVINQFEGVKSELLGDVSVHQGEVNQANAALTACNTNMQLSFNEANGVEDLAAKVGVERTDHSDCRVLENSNKETKTTKCDQFKGLVDSATCAELKSAPWLTSNGGGLVDAAKACATATSNLTNTSVQCDKEQETFERAFCDYAGALNTACGTHDGCWTRESGRRNTTYRDVRKLQVSHIAIWAAFSKANCFLNLLKKAAHTNLTESDMKNCTQLTPNTTALDIAYPNASVRSNCSVIPGSPQPGNTSWRASEYGASPFTEHPQHLEDTQPCPMPPTPALWEEHRNFCVDANQRDMGQDGGHEELTLEECKALCDATAGCTAVEFYEAGWRGNTCYLHHGAVTQGSIGSQWADAKCFVKAQHDFTGVTGRLD